MENKKYFLNRVSSTEEYAEIYFCYVEVESLKRFRNELKKMRKAFSEARLITLVSSIDFPEPDSVRTFYLSSDTGDFLEGLFEKHKKEQNQWFAQLDKPIASDFLDENESDVSISEFKIRFIEKDWAFFVGRFKHFYGEVETNAIRQDLILGDQIEIEKESKDHKFVCFVCKSENVSAKCWANPNDDEVIDYISDEAEDKFCEDCGRNTTLKDAKGLIQLKSI